MPRLSGVGHNDMHFGVTSFGNTDPRYRLIIRYAYGCEVMMDDSFEVTLALLPSDKYKRRGSESDGRKLLQRVEQSPPLYSRCRGSSIYQRASALHVRPVLQLQVAESTRTCNIPYVHP